MDEWEFQLGMERLRNMVSDAPASHIGDEESVGKNVCRMCHHTWSSQGKSKPKVCPKCRSTLWDCDTAKRVVCYRCGYGWVTVKSHPTKCPSCGSKRWEQKMLRITCNKCGQHWEDPLKEGSSVTCPSCGILGSGDYTINRIRVKSLAGTLGSGRDSLLDEELLRGMQTAGDELQKTLFLRRNGLTSEQADIIVMFDRGDNVPSIASLLSVPVSQVMDVVIEYMRVSEAMGMKSWS